MLLDHLCKEEKTIPGNISHQIVALFGQNASVSDFQKESISVLFLSRSKYNLLEIVRKLISKLKQKDFDVLHLHLRASSLLGSLLSLFLCKKIPTVMTLYALRRQISLPEILIYKLAARRAKRVITLWPESEQELFSSSNYSQKISHIRMGLDLSNAIAQTTRENRNALIRQYKLNETDPLFLCVSRLSQDRFVDAIIDAMHFICAKFPHAHLILVGDGPQKKTLESKTCRLGLTANIIFAGEQFDLWNLYSGCDIYLSMAGGYNLGISAIQAMACSRPVIAFNYYAMTEKQIICESDGVFILTSTPENMALAAISLLENRNFARDIGERARNKTLKEFSPNIMRERYLELYNSLSAENKISL